jgi:hypothetical protein
LAEKITSFLSWFGRNPLLVGNLVIASKLAEMDIIGGTAQVPKANCKGAGNGSASID